MNRLSHSFFSNRSRNAFALILLLGCFCSASSSGYCAPPTKRNADATKIVSDKSPAKQSPNTSRTPRRSQEANDGALPESEALPFEWNAEGNDAANWLDPVKTKELRAQVLEEAKRWRKEWPEFPKIDQSQVQALGVRTISCGHVVFYTDLASSNDVDEIPEALDAAIPEICNFFHIDPSRFDDWQVDAFLMSDETNFARIGALKGRPAFLYGYSMGDRIFAKDQKIEYYNRFLLTHELVHTLMHEIFGDLRPRWYSEGSAEYVALHTWNPKQKVMTLAQIPESAEATPGFGRLRQIREIVKSERAPTLFRILSFQPRDFTDVSTYSWSWAFVMFLYNSPKYKDIAEVLPYWSIAEDPNRLFVDAIGDHWNELENDWASFIDRIDYGYDFDAESIDSPIASARLDSASGATIELDPTRGWQCSGLRLEAGSTYTITSSGRFEFYLASANRAMEFEGTGASLEYFNGAPVGRLQAVVVPDAEENTFEETYGVKGAGTLSPGEENFRFDAFSGEVAALRNRFGKNADGFEDVAPEEEKNAVSPNNRRTNRPSSGRAPGRSSGRYNALYPWNERVGLSGSSASITPKKSGTLYLRINGAPRYLSRNSGGVKARIKKAAPRDEE